MAMKRPARRGSRPLHAGATPAPAAGRHQRDSSEAGRIDLAAALRWAARLGLNEGVCNHFSLEIAPDRYLINPQGMHWSEIGAADLLLIDAGGAITEGHDGLEPSAFFIHSHIHRAHPRARCVMHTHMPYATALSIVAGGRLAWCSQNALRFFRRVTYDDTYSGLVLDAAEGQRIAASFDTGDVLFMASHGVVVTAPTVAWAFDDLYYLERACMQQVLAVQAAAGRPLHQIADDVCATVAAQVAGERQQSDLFFASIKRLLDRDEGGWRGH